METKNAIVLFSLGFIVLTGAIVYNPEPLPFELLVLEFLIRYRTPWLNDLFGSFTSLADFDIVFFFTIIFAGILLILQRLKQSILFLVAVGLTSGIMFVTKLLVNRPRPDFEYALGTPEFSSYPSGHTTTAIVLYGWIIFSLTERLRPVERVILRSLGIGLITIIAFSRLYLGVHWVLDIIGGFFLATPILVATRSTSHKLKTTPAQEAE